MLTLILLSVAPAAVAQTAAAAPNDRPEQGASNDAASARRQDETGAAIVVTGTAVPIARSEIGNSVSVIARETIEDRKAAYLQDILREVPGLAVNQAGSFGGQTQVRIRGAEANHVLVLVDGVDVSSVSTGEFDFSSLLANGIERVEVLRGPQSGLYGSNALAGVINVITTVGEGPRLAAATEYGSFDTNFGNASVRLGDRGTFLSASAMYRRTDGFSSAAIGTEPDGDRNLTGYVRAGAALGSLGRIDGSLRVVDKHTQTDGFDFTGGPLQGLAVDDNSYAQTHDLSGGLTFTFNPAAHWRTVLSAAYSAGRTVGGFGTTPGFGDRASRLKIGATATIDFTTPEFAHATHRLTGFAEFKEERYRNTFPFDPSQVAQQRRRLFGIGAEYRLGLFDRAFLSATIRYDANDRFSDDTSFSLAGTAQVGPAGTRLHASYGTGVTNPTFYEQFGFVPGQFVGNRALRPEKAAGWDFGVEQRMFGDRLLVDATYFRSVLTDEIVSLFPSVGNDAGRSTRSGLELSADVLLGPLSVNASYTRLNAKEADGTREVRRPRNQASLDLSGHFGPNGRGTFSAGAIYNGRMLDDDFRNYFTDGFTAQKTPLAAYAVARFSASYRLAGGVEIYGRLENAFDRQYQQALSYASPGRAIYAGARFTLP